MRLRVARILRRRAERQRNLSALGQKRLGVLDKWGHERTDSYRRFTGGFATQDCNHGQSSRTVRGIQHLQYPVFAMFFVKLIPRLGT